MKKQLITSVLEHEHPIYFNAYNITYLETNHSVENFHVKAGSFFDKFPDNADAAAYPQGIPLRTTSLYQ